MFAQFDTSVIANSWVYLFQIGMAFTLQLTVLSMLGGVALGTLLALGRMSSFKPLALVAAAYVNLIRAVPLVLVIFWFYFLVPYMAAWVIGAQEPVKVGTFWSALITFTLFQAAYYCEIMRGGIQAIPRGQVLAAQALGLRYWQVMGRIVLPQAFRNMLPVLLTQTIVLFQDTSLVYAIGAYDLLKGFEVAGKNFNRPVETYLVAAVFYFAICFSLSMLVRRLQKKIAIIR